MIPLFCAIVLLAAPGQAAQPASEPATLHGRVTDTSTGKPIPMARIRISLEARGQRVEYRLRTDEDGRYRIAELSAGRYAVTASKARYVTLAYGQRLPAPNGRPIDVTAGSTHQADIALPRASAIAGRVVDEAGEPVERAVVTAMRVGYSGGRRGFVPAGAIGITADTGEYRIQGLPAGSYYVLASERSAGFGSGGDADVGFLQVMYPAATKAGDARPVAVAAGQDLAGIDIALAPAATATVSGVVMTSRGQPASRVRLNMTAVDQPFGLGGETVTTADGRFSYPRVLPGRYEIHARKPGYADRPGEEPEGAIVPVTVAGADLTDVSVPLSRGGRLTGIVIPPEGATATPKDVGFVAQPIGDTFVFGVGFGSEALREDWTFEWPFLVAPRVIRTQRAPDGWYVSAVLRDGVDITDTPTSFREPDQVRIILAADAAEVKGSVAGADGQPADDYTVVLFPEDAGKWNVWSRFIHTSRPDQNREFRLTAPPGQYFVAAVASVAQEQWFDAAFLQQLKAVAAQLTLEPRARRSLSLNVVKP